MKKRPQSGIALALAGLMLAGCSNTPTTATPEPPVASSAAPTEPSGTPAAPAAADDEPRGTRANPLPYGEPVVIEDIGEMGGPAWKVTVDEPRDMSEEILADAIELYGDEDESYLAPSRPEPGTTFIGFTATVERLMDTPATPGEDLEAKVIGSDGQTYDALVLGVGGPEEYIQNISEMYAPATARFAEVQVMPEGTTAAQVLIIVRNTNERFYFGPPAK